MRVLIACEYSGVIRDEFAKRGHDAWSCDLQDTQRPGQHLIGNCLDFINDGWDLMIAHPPCKYLATSGYWRVYDDPDRVTHVGPALDLVIRLMAAPIPRIAIENPVSIIGGRIRPADQAIQPWMFGHNDSKNTCLWLKGLPLLQPTNILPGGRAARRDNQTASGQNKLGPSKNRALVRSKTYSGIAKAMADQWGNPNALRIAQDAQMSLLWGDDQTPPRKPRRGHL